MDLADRAGYSDAFFSPKEYTVEEIAGTRRAFESLPSDHIAKQSYRECGNLSGVYESVALHLHDIVRLSFSSRARREHQAAIQQAEEIGDAAHFLRFRFHPFVYVPLTVLTVAYATHLQYFAARMLHPEGSPPDVSFGALCGLALLVGPLIMRFMTEKDFKRQLRRVEGALPR